MANRSSSRIDICRMRLANQHLTRQSVKTASEIVGRLGAVQAQEYNGAKWGVAQRAVGVSDAAIEQEINDGRILRTHVLRPTWHFVLPEDIRWMLALSAPRIRASAAHYDRKLGIDANVLRRSRALLTKTLRDDVHLTRREVADALTKGGVRAEGTQLLAHLMMHAELDGLVCSGPRRGKQFTYALLEERAPPTKALDRDVAVHTLAVRYFTSRGPATAHDFAWWSGLTKTDATAAAQSLGSNFTTSTVDGRTYWYPRGDLTRGSESPVVRLLPTYDEYLVAYADRRAAQTRVNPSHVGETFDFLGTNVIIIDGQIVGRWKREISNSSTNVVVQSLTDLTERENDAVRREMAKLRAFTGAI